MKEFCERLTQHRFRFVPGGRRDERIQGEGRLLGSLFEGVLIGEYTVSFSFDRLKNKRNPPILLTGFSFQKVEGI